MPVIRCCASVIFLMAWRSQTAFELVFTIILNYFVFLLV